MKIDLWFPVFCCGHSVVPTRIFQRLPWAALFYESSLNGVQGLPLEDSYIKLPASEKLSRSFVTWVIYDRDQGRLVVNILKIKSISVSRVVINHSRIVEESLIATVDLKI